MIEITKMLIEDYNQIKDNLQNDFDDFWTPTSLLKELENDNNYFVVAKQNDLVVGFAGLLKNIDYNEILNIVVHKNYRSQKIGQHLLDELISYSQKDNKKGITLEVNEHNTIAYYLYNKNSFKEVGRRKNYYNNQFDAILMTKDFN